ncbi:hypothetical protein SBA_ch1_33900 [Sphingomonas bisphenolicum]|uniref:Uncharacterized protein n=1 Tax=Sphingomonas bisphenolicum TaxID=296544 RepID=A0ABM7G760_9SPHN|nr:hypothetical protein SBA_ch1_33900 [Sphingomonas bisphenolicum]
MPAWARATGGRWWTIQEAAWTNIAYASFVAILRLISVFRKRSFARFTLPGWR